MEVMDTKTEDGVHFVLLHYLGQAKKYDEWRPLNEIVNVPAKFLRSTPAATSAFYLQLSVSIKESLSIPRKTDRFNELWVANSTRCF